MKNLFLLTFLFLLSYTGFPQISWHSPAADPGVTIQGQGWPGELKGSFKRLPPRAQEQIRPAVWQLSQNSAGLSIRFYSNAPQIIVRYHVTGGYSMPHMPTTGVSGIDLYATDMNGQELWCAGNYSFGDTISYTFKNLTYSQSGSKGYEYTLYLPPYNTVDWLRIGVPENSSFGYVPCGREKPIVVYGTSIAQGACASRPGMIWTSILGRRTDNPLINLGFSGNGKLEPSVISLLTELDASLFVLDCMPNLTGESIDKTEQLLKDAVLQIRAKHPQTPILLTEHDGYGNWRTSESQENSFKNVNIASRKAYDALCSQKIPHLYYLSNQEINMPQEGMVDGVHATDYGMIHYANAYEKKIREILHTPTGTVRTTQPVTQRRDFPTYEWKKRHAEVLELNQQAPPRGVIIGNSITHYWGGKPEAPQKFGPISWEQHMTPAGFHNLGFGWDKIENMLWRIYHGELDGYQAEKVILLAGTNNLSSDNDQDILCGIDTLISAIRYRQPQAQILVLGILPRREMEKRVKELNQQIRKLTIRRSVEYADPGQTLLTPKNKIEEHLFLDGTHLNEKGYEKILSELKRIKKV